MNTFEKILDKIVRIERGHGSCKQTKLLKEYIKKEYIHHKNNTAYSFQAFICTGEKDQVVILAEDKEQAESKFRTIHEIPDTELVEIVQV